MNHQSRISTSMGNSGATFQRVSLMGEPALRKHGGTTDLNKQARLCIQLGKDICPDVYEIGPDWYSMEILEPLSSRDYLDLLVKLKFILETQVWDSKPYEFHAAWQSNVIRFIDEFNFKRWILPLGLGVDMCDQFNELYPSVDKIVWDSEKPRYSLIHGDPTLSNVMVRRSRPGNREELVIIDPVPCRDNVPPLKEIDMAALVQSACGWEHALDPDNWPDAPGGLVGGLLGNESEWTYRQVMFWAAYKCLRILHRNRLPASITWARKYIHLFTDRRV